MKPLSSSLVYIFFAFAVSARAQIAPNGPHDNSNSPVVLDAAIVTGQLDQAREQIVPQLGATSYLIDSTQIGNLSQGANAAFTQLLLRAPGVAQDSEPNGGVHVRGEHANLQYRINDVLLPEGISGFGLELDPRFVDTLQLVTGSLPAQYGFRTAGIVDIHTKSAAATEGSETSLYAGSFDTFHPSLETSGSAGRLSYFATAGFDSNDLGIENPTSSRSALHDHTEQTKIFVSGSYLIDQSSRFSVLASSSISTYQIPDTPGLPAGISPAGKPWLPGNFDSAKLNENQKEKNDYIVAAYQKSADLLNFQWSAFARESRVDFDPDPVGDFYFDGVASKVGRRLDSIGIEGDGSLSLIPQHTVRAGLTMLNEAVAANTTTTVFSVDSEGNASGAAFPISDREKLHGFFGGVYLQDEWKITPQMTMNYGARFDVFRASFDKETQLSPRLNFVYQPSENTTLHAGYARYFTPPPVENVPSATVVQFNGTSNASAIDQDDPVKAERSHYFDLGLSQKIAEGLRIGLDGYYKRARDQLDDGLFGQTLILSAFNYQKGEVYGLEASASYTHAGFSSYVNLAHSVAKGENWISSQFLFDPADLAYVRNHWIRLDHDQTLTLSSGVAYLWTHGSGATRVLVDFLYGSGLRTNATGADGANLPNGGTVPSDYTINIGIEETLKLAPRQSVIARLDVVNITDQIYELRDGVGVGVNAAQYGMRRGFFGTVSYAF